MQTNPNQHIHTDYKINDVFKPEAANQLARAIHYDFVITQKMLDKFLEKNPGVTEIDVGNLIASNEDGTIGSWETPIKAPANILIAAKTSANDSFTFHFGGRLIGRDASWGVGNIIDCTDFMVNGSYNRNTTIDMVNVYSLYPYRMSVAVAGFNHWTTPQNYVKIQPNVPYNAGVFKVGTYTMPSNIDMVERDNLQIVSQNSLGGSFIISPSASHIETGYNPAVVYANWMGGGGGVTTNYAIRGQDMTNPTTTAYGLYQQMQASVADWNTEPILVVSHNYSTARYQLSGWDSDEFRFSNVSEGKIVIIRKDGTVQWKTAGAASGSGSSDVIIFQDDGVVIPHKSGPQFVAYTTSLVSTDNYVRYSLLQNGQFTVFNSKTAEVPLFKEPSSAGEYGLRPYGVNHIIWNTWYQIKAYGIFMDDPEGATSHIKTITNGSKGSITRGHNNLSTMIIVTDALIEGLVYEVDINIRSLAKLGDAETGQIGPGGELYGQMYAPNRYTPHFGLAFYTESGFSVTPKRWADPTKSSYYVVFPRFNSVPSNGDGTGFGPGSGSGQSAPVLATAKVYFMKINGNIYTMSY